MTGIASTMLMQFSESLWVIGALRMLIVMATAAVMTTVAGVRSASPRLSVTVNVTLNGDAPGWMDMPSAVSARVNYSVSGTANNPADHDLVAGFLTFDPTEYSQPITFTVATDVLTDPNETIVITLDSASGAAIGTSSTHTVTIIEGNVAPAAELQFGQGANPVVGPVYTADGTVAINALVTDVNSGQAHSYDWSASTLPNPGDVASWDPGALLEEDGQVLAALVR